jgi:hypothetical protein
VANTGCDPATGTCKNLCTGVANKPQCALPEVCDPTSGGCVNRCEGVSCPAQQACNPQNGQCASKCSLANCKATESCDADTGACSAKCESASKPAGKDACASGQKCKATTGECVGLCDEVACAYAMWCDDTTGKCVGGAAPAGRTGAACATSEDCSTSGLAADQGVECLTDFRGAIQFPEGYCAASCDAGLVCPQGASCLQGIGCLDQCTKSSDCRAGYHCTPLGEGEYACFPSSQCKSSNPAECASVGGDCASDEDCLSGANCIAEQSPVTNPQTGAQTGEFEFSGFEKGYCIYTMRSSDTCPSGSTGVAVDQNDPNFFYCLASCNIGQMGCGLGESCLQVDQNSTAGVCWQAQCSATSECQTAACTQQDTSSCGKGQTCTAGFCRTVDTCTTDADCPAISQDGSIKAACDTDKGECRMAAYCDGSLGTCTLDCTVADVFSETTGACAAKPCKAGFVCTNDATVAEGYKCEDAGICAAGTVCNGVTRQCDRACKRDAQCGENAVCEDELCTAACTANNEKVVCDGATEVCGLTGHCVSKCAGDLDCGDGFYCQVDSGRCLQRCDAGATCKDAEYCDADGRCALKCTALNELSVCGQSLYCQTSTGQCVADCRTDEAICGAEACSVSGLSTPPTADDLGICGLECVSDAGCGKTPGGDTLKCLPAGTVKRCQKVVVP